MIAFYMIQQDFSHILQISSNSRGEPNFLGGGPILQNGWISWSPLLHFNFKNWTTQILCHSLDLIVFYMIQHYFCHILKISRNSRGGDLISWGKPFLQNGWIILSPLLYFSFNKSTHLCLILSKIKSCII